MPTLLALAAALVPCAIPPPLADDPRPEELWTALVRSGYEPPAGEDPTELLLELSAHLGVRDLVLDVLVGR